MSRTGLTSSGLRAADAAIAGMPSQIFGIQVITDGTNAATLTIYDNAAAASGEVLAKISVAGADRSQSVVYEHGIVANNGIYCDVSGTGAEYIVHFILGC